MVKYVTVMLSNMPSHASVCSLSFSLRLMSMHSMHVLLLFPDNSVALVFHIHSCPRSYHREPNKGTSNSNTVAI